MTDPIADMLTRLRNAVNARHTRVDVPASRLKAEIAKILEREGFDRYLEAKARIVAHQRAGDMLVYCSDDDGARRIAARAPGRRKAATSTAVQAG